MSSNAVQTLWFTESDITKHLQCNTSSNLTWFILAFYSKYSLITNVCCVWCRYDQELVAKHLTSEFAGRRKKASVRSILTLERKLVMCKYHKFYRIVNQKIRNFSFWFSHTIASNPLYTVNAITLRRTSNFTLCCMSVPSFNECILFGKI